MSGETFGQMLRRLREAPIADPNRHQYRWAGPRPMSQNRLALRSGVDVAYINRMEAERNGPPPRATVVKLAEGLSLSPLDTDRLLIAAGHWPWPDQAEDTERALSAVHGDLYAGSTG